MQVNKSGDSQAFGAHARLAGVQRQAKPGAGGRAGGVGRVVRLQAPPVQGPEAAHAAL